ncbi:hypothetical protein MHH66_20960 [Bacillus sp. FSL H8-0492]|uniref:hypothetical protein n=1 Tax=Bacillus sp. FSL H8-0492 TaxID=2921392 RepID=UPI0007B31A52|nr:hypothetical protein [Bacillus mycoides]KZD36807.1 hypothetical protein B4083_3012 [Bacillus cereus]
MEYHNKIKQLLECVNCLEDNEIELNCDGEEITIELFNSEEIEEGQIGYRITDNGESLMSDEEESWQEGWIVIGLDSYIGDPIFVDTKDIACAVYTAEHGEGIWNPVLVAESIDQVIQAVKQK